MSTVTKEILGYGTVEVPVLPPVVPEVSAIVRAYSAVIGVAVEDLAGPSQAAAISEHRHRLMYLIRVIDPTASYQRIGHALGGRDMSTVLEAVRKQKAMAAVDGSLSRDLWNLERQVVLRLTAEARLQKESAPWQLRAACSVLRDPQLSDAEARKAALGFLQQLEVAHG